MLEIIPIDTPSLGDRSYLAHDGEVALVVDPRPDLLGPCHTPMLVHRQFDSARRLASVLPDPTPVFPTHGFGSFCSAAQAEATSSTIGQEKRGNPTLILGEHDYAQALLAGLDVWPAYYAHMAPANLAGPHAPDLSPPAPADARALRRR